MKEENTQGYEEYKVETPTLDELKTRDRCESVF